MQRGEVIQMQEETRTFLQVLSIAGLGGGINYIRHHRSGGFRALELAASIAVSAFAGMEAHFLVRWMGLSVDLQFAIAGIAGYGGGMLLDTAVNIAHQIMHARAGTRAGAWEKKRGGGGPA